MLTSLISIYLDPSRVHVTAFGYNSNPHRLLTLLALYLLLPLLACPLSSLGQTRKRVLRHPLSILWPHDLMDDFMFAARDTQRIQSTTPSLERGMRSNQVVIPE